MEKIAAPESITVNSNLQIQVCDNPINPEWDAFVANSPWGSHVQTSLWAQVKAESGWRAFRIILMDAQKIVGGGQIIVRQVAPFIKVGFVPKGPLCDPEDSRFIESFFAELHRVAAYRHIQLLAIQPLFNGGTISKEIFRWGFRPSWLELASTATILIDLSLEPDQIQAQMKRQTRQNIRRSEREGITTREGNESDLASFYRFHVSTSQRQGFVPYSEDYYKRMWQILSPHKYIQLIIAEFEDRPVSALLLIPFGDTVVAKILGWSGDHAECRPNDAVFWASICWAKSHGYRYFDLEGINRQCAIDVLQGNPIPEDKKDSYTFFKLGYGGKITLYPEACDYVYNPVLRWFYRKIFSKPEQRTSTYDWFDQFRRRYG